MNENAVDTFEVKGLKVGIIQDEDASNPREDFDNFGHMVCFHRRYDLGDQHDFSSPDDVIEWLQGQGRDVIYLPIYAYEHGGITLRTGAFNDPFDSGQVGIIYVTREEVRKEYNCKRISKATLRKVIALLNAEVEEYDSYLTGDVWGYVIEDENEEVLDSCWGFYGYQYCKDEAKEQAEWYATDIASKKWQAAHEQAVEAE